MRALQGRVVRVMEPGMEPALQEVLVLGCGSASSGGPKLGPDQGGSLGQDVGMMTGPGPDPESASGGP